MAEAWVVLASLAIEAAIGYPAALHSRVPHPVVWAGNAISVLENWWNRERDAFAVRRLLGCVVVLLLTGVAVLAGLGLQWLVSAVADAVAGPIWAHVTGSLAIALIGTTGLAQRSLFDHVDEVLFSLRAGDIEASRERVSLIVGRDTRQLDARGVSAAALESLAESFNDGIVAPAFWFLIAGLPGLFAYKALNTADSLIGHKEERWRAFGWAAARADDVANLVPARIAGALLVLAGMGGVGVMLSDASKHSSPNAGWPEAAMAGALGIRLGGPATYDGVLHQRPVFGAGPPPGVGDLARGLRLYVVACGLLWLAVGIVGAAEVAMGAGVVWPL
jgi:adenosylcobinamide-phosphate synthase